MDASGNLYACKRLADALNESGANEVSVVRAATEKQIARIAARPGCASLTEDELKHLASLPRKQRRAALAELRRL